ncbi:hypothetical protein QU487_11940 [Crenobacter sp. SG2305]|uniref:hypothetical protein n=1 Tax=Crenobacter oryzisoli TaxID=3056844 RepID=UPI0025AB1736|nr:hypothetical protein [Crenobacter sp. SG2305]MDN0083456.1 hypothetical protein [Crenobacter sp. SG2305]
MTQRSKSVIIAMTMFQASVYDPHRASWDCVWLKTLFIDIYGVRCAVLCSAGGRAVANSEPMLKDLLQNRREGRYAANIFALEI